MKYMIVNGTVIRTPKKYAGNDTFIGDYSTCLLSTNEGKESVITLIDFDTAKMASQAMLKSIHLELTYKKTGTKFASQSCKMHDKSGLTHSYYACNIVFPTLEEAKKEYIKLNLLHSL